MIYVIRYGCRTLTENPESALTEMRRGGQYFNALVAIERWRRREYAVIRSRYVPFLAEMEAADEQIGLYIEEQRDKIREKRRKVSVATAVHPKRAKPTKRVPVEEERTEIESLIVWRKELRVRLTAARAAFVAMIGPAAAEYKRRTGEAPQGDNWAKKRLNAEGRTAMLGEDWHPAWKDVATLEQSAYELKNWVFQGCGLNHGTYTAVRDAVAQAGKPPRPRPDGQPLRPRARPEFSRRRFRKMGWQVPRKWSWGDILAGKSSELRVDSLESACTRKGKKNPQNHSPEELAKRAREGTGSGSRSRMKYAKIRIRIGETWVAAECFMHRPIPEDAVVRWVYLVPKDERRLRDGRLVPKTYELQLTIEMERKLIERAPGVGLAEIRLGWTKTESGGLIVGRLGSGRVIELPWEVIDGLGKSASIRSAADQYFDVAKEALLTRLEEGGAPEWIAGDTKTAAHWRSHEKLARIAERWVRETALSVPLPELWQRWKAFRAVIRAAHGAEAGDLYTSLPELSTWLGQQGLSPETHFPVWLEWWHRKDRHLKELETNLSRRARNRRLKFYGETAAKLSMEFQRCDIMPLDLAGAALRDMPEAAPKELHEAARRQRVQAATSELKAALANAFGPDRYRERSGDDEPAVGARRVVKPNVSAGLPQGLQAGAE